MTALLDGKLVTLIGEVYRGSPRGEHAGRDWTMVQEKGCTWWKPAWMDELKEVPSDGE